MRPSRERSTTAMRQGSSGSSAGSPTAWMSRTPAAEYVVESQTLLRYASAGTMIRGYSDRINHAFAFAAKHHDQQVRKGTRLPYLTHPANVAIILTRYGQDEDTVVAGILHDVIEDCVRGGYTSDALRTRIGEKFGESVLETVLAVSEARIGPDGAELSYEERKEDYLNRLAQAD